MTPTRRRRAAHAVAALGCFLGTTLGFVPVAQAQPPTQVGWWNAVSAGGNAAPSPSTPAGGIRVAAAPGQVLAFGAVLYPMPAFASGTLTLTISGSQGTPVVEACPTKSTSWKAGDDQSIDAAPTYDCSAFHYSGTVSADGTSVTFNVSAFGQPTAGLLSLAIVPDLSGGSGGSGVAAPFSVDVDKPGATSLNVTSAPPPTTPTPTFPASQPAPASAVVPPSQQAGRPLGVPLTGGSSTATVAPSAAPAPQVAPTGQPAATTNVAASSSGSVASTAGSVIGALVLVAAFLFWGLGRGLLGGRIVPLSQPISAAATSPHTQSAR